MNDSMLVGFKLDADGGERLRFGDVEVVIRASAETTGGAFSIVEESAQADTPLHVHEHEDELFYVLAGEHVFQVGEEMFEAGPGAYARVSKKYGITWL